MPLHSVLIALPVPGAAAQPDLDPPAALLPGAAQSAARSSLADRDERMPARLRSDTALEQCEAAPGSPQALLDTAQRRLILRGASRLDNAIAFYGPLIGRLRAHLDQRCREVFSVDIALSAIDSGSTNMLFALFDTLNEGALAGNTIAVRWQRQDTDRHCFTFRNALRDRFPLLRFAD
jgi:hypothetical protein